MSSRRPPSLRDPEYLQWFHGRQLQSMVPGAASGRVASAAPVRTLNGSPVGDEGASIQLDVGGEADLSKVDIFTLASAGAQDLALTYLPKADSWNVSLNGITALNGTDYSILAQTLSLLSPIDARTGDVVEVQYDYLAGVPAAPAEGGTAYDTEVLADSPIAYWKLDDPGALVDDFTGHGHIGTIGGSGVTRGTSSMMPTDIDESTTFAYLSGSGSGHFTVPDSAAFDTSAFTVEFWTDRGTSGGMVLLEHPGRLRIELASGDAGVKVWSGGAWSTVAFTGTSGFTGRGAFAHFAITYDGTNVRYYHNGTLYATVAASPSLTSGTADLIVGPYTGIGTVEDDRLQKIALYGTALSGARIAAHYAAG